MNPPSLLYIASRKVANYILEGKYNNVDYVLCEKGSNIVFDIVKEQKIYAGDQYEKVEEVLQKMVRPTKMNFNHHNFYYEMTDKDLEMMKIQHLDELKLGKFYDFKNYIKEKMFVEPPKKRRATRKRAEQTIPADDSKEFDVVAFLQDNLRPETQQRLKKLEISKRRNVKSSLPFPENWTQSISQLLPSLISLTVSIHHLTNTEFSTLCDSFPNLLTLDINESEVTDLKGISKLSFLQDLSIGLANLENAKCLDEIYKLENLQKLRLTCNGDMRGYKSNVPLFFVHSRKSVKGLLELDLSDSDIQENDLKKIIKRHPTLKRIIAFRTDIEVSEIDGVEVLHSCEIPDMLRELDYLHERGDSTLNNILFSILRDVHQTRVDELSTEVLRAVIQKMYIMIPLYEHDEDIIGLMGTCCGNFINENKFHLYENCDKRVLIECFLMLTDLMRVYKPKEYPTEHDYEWDHVRDLVRITKDPNTDRIVAKAIENFLIADGNKWGLKCLEVIDHLLERINMDAEFYKGMNKEKLVAALKKTYEDCSTETDEENNEKVLEHKAMAGRVMRFFENLSK